MLQRAALRVRRVGQHEPVARAGHRDVQHAAHLGDVLLAGVRRAAPTRPATPSGIGSTSTPPRPGHPRRLQAADEDVVELQPLGGVHRQDGDGVVARRRAVLVLGVADPARLGHRGQPARELARRRLRRAPHVGRGQLADRRAATRAARRRRPARRRAAGGAGPRRSISRCTKRSGRVVSSAAAASRWSFRNARMRSRASGGSCGDSVAATSALTMSSLRRLAIWMQRARSTERSSIGGRASARTTAPASLGSTSSRSQASTSRTSARPKNAAAPASRNGSARSSSATASAWPSLRTERTSTPIRPGATPSRTSRSISAATPWACARSLAQRQNRTSPSAPEPTLAPAPRCPRAGRRSAPRPPRRRPRRAPGSAASAPAGRPRPHAHRSALPAARAAGPRRRAARRSPDRRRPWRRGRRGRRPAAGPPAPGPASRSSRSSTSTWRQRRRDPRADVRPLLQQRVGAQHQVAEVERALLEQQPVVGLEEPGELALALGALVVLGQRRRPLASAAAGCRPPSSRSIRAMTAPSSVAGLPRKSWRRSGSSSTRSSSIARRSAGETVTTNGSMPGLERLVAQQPRADAVDRVDRQLLERPVAERVLDAGAQRVGGGRGAREQQDLLGRGPARHEPGEAVDQQLRAPVPAPPRTSSGPPPGGRHLARGRGAVLGRDGAGGSGHALGYGPDDVASRPRPRLARRVPRGGEGLRDVLAENPTSKERVIETGETGEGGDQTLVIDAAAEDAVFAELDRLHATGARFTAVSEERGYVDFGSDDALVVIDPIDGSHERQARAHPPRAVDRGRRRPDDGRRRLRLRLRPRPGRGVVRDARRRRLLNDAPLDHAAARAPHARRAPRAASRSSRPTRAGWPPPATRSCA